MGFLFVALGGAAGAMGRYAISLLPVRTGFPILTLLVNILGAALIGFIAGVAGDNSDVSSNTVLFWKTGVCGGFTTFSTFSLEAFTLFESKAWLAGGVYIFLSVACCLAGIFLGKSCPCWPADSLEAAAGIGICYAYISAAGRDL